MDEATRRLLFAIGEHLKDLPDKRVAEVRIAALRARADGDAERASSDLRHLQRLDHEREGVRRSRTSRGPGRPSLPTCGKESGRGGLQVSAPASGTNAPGAGTKE